MEKVTKRVQRKVVGIAVVITTQISATSRKQNGIMPGLPCSLSSNGVDITMPSSSMRREKEKVAKERQKDMERKKKKKEEMETAR